MGDRIDLGSIGLPGFFIQNGVRCNVNDIRAYLAAHIMSPAAVADFGVRLGQGSFGTVCASRTEPTECYKVVHVNGSVGWQNSAIMEGIKAFLASANGGTGTILCGVPVSGIFMLPNGDIVIKMARAEMSLSTFLNTKAWTHESLSRIIVELFIKLRYFNQKYGFIPGDFHMGNVLLYRGQWVFADFGRSTMRLGNFTDRVLAGFRTHTDPAVDALYMLVALTQRRNGLYPHAAHACTQNPTIQAMCNRWALARGGGGAGGLFGTSITALRSSVGGRFQEIAMGRASLVTHGLTLNDLIAATEPALLARVIAWYQAASTVGGGGGGGGAGDAAARIGNAEAPERRQGGTGIPERLSRLEMQLRMQRLERERRRERVTPLTLRAAMQQAGQAAQGFAVAGVAAAAQFWQGAALPVLGAAAGRLQILTSDAFGALQRRIANLRAAVRAPPRAVKGMPQVSRGARVRMGSVDDGLAAAPLPAEDGMAAARLPIQDGPKEGEGPLGDTPAGINGNAAAFSGGGGGAAAAAAPFDPLVLPWLEAALNPSAAAAPNGGGGAAAAPNGGGGGGAAAAAAAPPYFPSTSAALAYLRGTGGGGGGGGGSGPPGGGSGAPSGGYRKSRKLYKKKRRTTRGRHTKR
jgi:hypothetical protein